MSVEIKWFLVIDGSQGGPENRSALLEWWHCSDSLPAKYYFEKFPCTVFGQNKKI